MSKILAVVVSFYPEAQLLKKCINAFIDEVDKVLVWENTPIEKRLEYRYVIHQKVEYCGDGINSISRALNHAWNYARDKGYDYLLTIDQDSVIINPHELIRAATNDGKAPLGIYATGGPSNPAFSRSFKYRIRHLLVKYYTHFYPFRYQKWEILSPQEQEKYKKDYGSLWYSEKTNCRCFESHITSGSMIPISILNEVGGYEESFQIDGIDIDLCLRVRKNGYKIYGVYGSSLHHRYGSPDCRSLFGKKVIIFRYPANRLYGMIRNHIIISRKYRSWPIFKRVIKQYIGKSFFNILMWEDHKQEKMKMILKGFHDGFCYKLSDLTC